MTILACGPFQKTAGAPVSDIYEFSQFHQRDISPPNFPDGFIEVSVQGPKRSNPISHKKAKENLVKCSTNKILTEHQNCVLSFFPTSLIINHPTTCQIYFIYVQTGWGFWPNLSPFSVHLGREICMFVVHRITLLSACGLHLDHSLHRMTTMKATS